MARFGKKCIEDGITFASEPERDFYLRLKELKKDGKIQDFHVQPEFPLQEAFETNFNDRWDNLKIKETVIKPDYQVLLNDDEVILLDTKGANCIEPESQLKRKIFLYQNKEVPLFFIGQLPKYLGGEWVNVTKGVDFLPKLKTRYNNTYFNDILDYNKNRPKGTKAKQIPRSKPVNWKVSDWDEHFEYEDVDGLFYIWKKTKRKIKK